MTIFFMDGEPLKRIMDQNLQFTKEISSMEKSMVKVNMSMDPIIFIMEIGHLIRKMEKGFISTHKDSIMVNGKVTKSKVKAH